jgi:mannose-6-phosphate isomerase-like protein (cupin superfamily)
VSSAGEERPEDAAGAADERLDAAAFTLEGLRAAHATGGRLYHEFLRVPALSAGIYVLPAGGDDPQQPHREDEVYYVIAGRGRFTMGAGPDADDIAVGPGDVLYVAKEVEHRFHGIAEELTVLVLFAPAEPR